MKQVNPNISRTVAEKFISEMAFVRKFKRLWGVEVFEGEEVFTPKIYYYPKKDRPENFDELAKFLGITTSVNASMKGIEKAWLTLNYEKAEAPNLAVNVDKLVANLNSALGGVTSGTVTLANQTGVSSRFTQNSFSVSSSVANQTAIIEEITTGYQNYWDNNVVISGEAKSKYLNLFLIYLLRSSTIPYTVETVETFTKYITGPSTVSATRTVTTTAYRVKLRWSSTTLTPTTDIVLLMAEDLVKATKNASNADKAAKEYVTSGADTDVENSPYSNVLEGNVGNYWHAGPTTNGRFGGVHSYYLKTSVLNDTSTRSSARISYLTSAIDSGYKEEPLEWYEVLFIVVIVIVAAIISPGTVTNPNFWKAMFAAFAAISTVALVLTIVQYVAAAAGNLRFANGVGNFLKGIDPLVRIAQVVTFIVGIGQTVTAIKESIKKAAVEGAKEGVKQSIMSSVKAGLKTTFKEGLERYTGITSLSNIGFVESIKLLNFAFDQYAANQSEKMNDAVNKDRKLLAKLTEQEEQAKTSDILKDFAEQYPNLLARDNSVYADRYDRPYEWWATAYHTGCIQANSVSALWLTRS